MSDLTTYRIYGCEHDFSPEHPAFPNYLGGHLYGAMEECEGSGFVPDTRLQAIADAWKAHKQAMGEGQFRDTYATLYALLDALTEDADEHG